MSRLTALQKIICRRSCANFFPDGRRFQPETLVAVCQLCSEELTPSQKSFHRVIIPLPVATNQLKAQDIESATRRTTVFGSDQRESPQDSEGLPGLCVERRRPGRLVSGNPVSNLAGIAGPETRQSCQHLALPDCPQHFDQLRPPARGPCRSGWSRFFWRTFPTKKWPRYSASARAT